MPVESKHISKHRYIATMYNIRPRLTWLSARQQSGISSSPEEAGAGGTVSRYVFGGLLHHGKYAADCRRGTLTFIVRFRKADLEAKELPSVHHSRLAGDLQMMKNKFLALIGKCR